MDHPNYLNKAVFGDTGEGHVKRILSLSDQLRQKFPLSLIKPRHDWYHLIYKFKPNKQIFKPHGKMADFPKVSFVLFFQREPTRWYCPREDLQFTKVELAKGIRN